MPPTLRDLVGDIREALDRFEPDALKEILTYVFKEYVVEGAAPLQSNPPALTDDLDGLPFARLITRLQQRLDLPELALFEVQGERVLLKVGAQKLPIEAQGPRPEPAPPPPAPAPMAVPQPAQSLPPTVAAAPAPAPRAAPVPAPRGAPGASREELRSTRPVAPPTTAPAAPPAPAPVAIKSTAPKADDKGESKDRFGKLEID